MATYQRGADPVMIQQNPRMARVFRQDNICTAQSFHGARTDIFKVADWRSDNI
jgi:hypothetical protein